MRFLLGIFQGFKEIWAHKFRSILTMLGIILGVASLMAMFAMTAGIANGTREFIVAIGGVEKVEVRDSEPPPSQESIAEISPGRTYQDAVALRTSPLIAAVSPTVDLSGARLTRLNMSSRPTIIGAEYPFLEVENHEIELGRFISDMDMEMGNRVVVLGRNIVDELWTEPNTDPVGQFVKINGYTFKVVGVFKRYVRARDERMKNKAPSPLAMAATNRGVTPSAQPILRGPNDTAGLPGGSGIERMQPTISGAGAEGSTGSSGGGLGGQGGGQRRRPRGEGGPSGGPRFAGTNSPAGTNTIAGGPGSSDPAQAERRARWRQQRQQQGEGGQSGAGFTPGGPGLPPTAGQQGGANRQRGPGGEGEQGGPGGSARQREMAGATPTSTTTTTSGGGQRSGDPSRDARRANRGDPFRFKNTAVVIPLSTMQQIFKSVKPNATNSSINEGQDNKLTRLTARVNSFETFEDTLAQMRTILLLTHRGIEDFTFDTRLEQFDRMESSMAAVRMSGGIIAGISLLVGGLGITNIMLASISERVREIGIRRAVGARGIDIFLQILIEGIVLSFMGGLLGLAAGVGLVSFLEFIVTLDNAPVIEASSIIVSLTYAIIVGIFAGFYPAYKAAQLSPLQALRYE
ncbi:hypothetical protein DB346_06060 [Verrucomicrobia bacterium LW23]|nr:hypothetical protein DB346_06060 [Verrucomicrobia bacterium LW23]